MAHHTHYDFSNLMQMFAVPVKNNCAINKAGRIEGHERDFTLFTGTDYYGRLFVNLPVKITAVDGSVTPTSIIIHQAAFGSSTFRVSGDLPFGVTWDMLLKNDRYSRELDFLKLAVLLSGRTVSIYECLPTEESRRLIDDPTRYISLSLITSN